jgi:ABC-type dipeptide/oligopeptide/nickel transport system permease subunit
MIATALLLTLITSIITLSIGYIIGYKSGFNKCKEIDNSIIDSLTIKQKKKIKEIS